MKLSRLTLSAAIGILVAVTFAFGRDSGEIIKKYQFSPLDISNIARTNRVTHTNNVWLNTTNWGFLGNFDPSSYGAMMDPEIPGTWAPQCEFPGGSGIQYLFAGGLWVGALVDTGGFEFPRVSVGTEGWTGPGLNQFELEPGEVGGMPVQDHGILERSCLPGAVNYLGQPIYSPEAIAPQEFIGTFCDTLTETFWVGRDIVDGPHLPLGLKVTQKSMVWDAFGFDDFVMIELTVKNIGNRNLKNPYLGFYIDGDVGQQDEGNRHEDDVTGYLASYLGQPCEIPYIADNDGRPVGVNQGNDFSCPGVSGIHVLDTPQETLYTACNWWISNGNSDLDYGPHWQDDGSYQGWTNIYGTPDGDARKYFLMSNKEKDFDQWWVADHTYLQAHPQTITDPFTGQTTTHPWALENLTYAYDLANGYDTRYMVSYGPIGVNIALPGQPPLTYLNPGDSTRLVFAYICAEGFHDPNNPQGNCSGNDPIDPTKYVYTDLAYNVAKAQWLYDQGYQILPPYKPQHFRVSTAPDSAVWLAWDAYTSMPGTGVNIYRRPEGGIYPSIPLNTTPITEAQYADQTAVPGQHYYYKAQAVRYDSLYSWFCPEIYFTAGAPLAPTGLSADSSGNAWVSISWNANTEPDLNHYTVYRRDTSLTFQAVGNVPAGTEVYHNVGLTNGLLYTYRITAVDNNGYEGAPSDSVTDIPMGFTEDLLVIRERIGTGAFEWLDYLLSNYYQQLFTDIGEDPDTMEISYNGSNISFASLPQLSPYKIVWLMHDTHAPANSLDYVNARNTILTQYIENGGKVIISGRNIFSGAFRFTNLWEWQALSSSHVLNQEFKLDSIFTTKYPDALHPPEFTAAVPAQQSYPALAVDTAKVRQANLLYSNPELWMPEVDAIMPEPEAQIFYTFQSADPDSSPLQGHAVGVHYLTPYFANVILTFPLYAMQPYDSVKTLAEKLLGDIRLGVPEIPEGKTTLPTAFALKSVYPNPFNPTAVIRYELRAASFVSLKIYDLAGRVVATVVDGWRQAGTHEVTFDGQGLASGMYFVKMTAGDYIGVKKMVLLK